MRIDKKHTEHKPELGSTWIYDEERQCLKIPVPANTTVEQAFFTVLSEIEEYAGRVQDDLSTPLTVEEEDPSYKVVERTIDGKSVIQLAVPFTNEWCGVPNLSIGTLVHPQP